MGCCHHYFAPTEEGDKAFTIDASTLTFGAGCLKEAGEQARALGTADAATNLAILVSGLCPARSVLAREDEKRNGASTGGGKAVLA